MNAEIHSLAQRMHRAWRYQEAVRIRRDLDRLAGLEVIDLPPEQRADGTLAWSARTPELRR